jgi:glutamine synthetase
VAIGNSAPFDGTSDDGERPETITSRRLTTCQVVENGKAVRLGFVDHDGKSSSVTFPFDQAESIVMTLPQMLSIALQQRTHNKQACYVFPLRRWSLESSGDDFLVANMMTNDGFQVSFAIPREVCKAIGWSLSQHGRPVLQDREGHGADEHVKLN